MGSKSAQVTAYIERQQPFARPILSKIRTLFHRACPQIQETRKWGAPFFEYKGIVGGIAGFKQHVRFILWKAKLLENRTGVFKGEDNTSIGAAKLTSLDDLPPDDVILDLIKQAVALNDSGVKSPPRGRTAASSGKPRPARKPPADLAAVLKRNAKAAATFKNFGPSHQRDYIEWITEAKQEQTRQRRLAQTIEWLSEGKPRNWKYLNKK